MSNKNPSVLWTVDQGLEDSQKDKARDNIGVKLDSVVTDSEHSTLTFVDDIPLANGDFTVSKKKVTVDIAYNATSNNPASGTAVASAISTAINNTLNLNHTVADGEYLQAISVSNGVATFTDGTLDTAPSRDSGKAITSGAVYTALLEKQNRPDNATSGNIATFNGNKDTVDSGKCFLSGNETWTGLDTDVPTALAVQNKINDSINDGTLSITVGSAQAKTFTANQSGNTTVTIPNAVSASGTSLATGGLMTDTDKTNLDANTAARHSHTNKTILDGIDSAKVSQWDAAEPNVNADWNATSGDAQILNKPTIPTVNDGELSITVGDNGTAQTFTANQLGDTSVSIPTGSGSSEGVLKLSASTTSTSGESGGYAATPSAVKAAYDLAASKQSPATTLSGYGITNAYTKTEVDGLLQDKANKSEMSISSGTGTATIQLKSGTSATVLTSHQDISGKANTSEMSVTPGTGTDADKTTIQLKSGTSATVLTAHQTIPVKDVKVKTTGGGKISIVDDSGIAIIDSATANGQVGVSRLYGSISVGDSNNGGGATPKAVSDFVEAYANVLVQYKADDAASNYTEITEILGRGLSPVLYVPAIHAGESVSYLHLSVSQDCYFHFTEPEDKKIYVLTVDNNVSPPTYSWAQYDLYAKSTEVPFLASSYDTVLYMVTNYGPKSVIPILHTGDRYVCNFKHRDYTYNQRLYHEFMWNDTEIISYNQHTGEIHHEYEIYTNPNGGPYSREYRSGLIPVVLEVSGNNYTCNYTYSELLAFYQDGIRFVFYIDDASIYSGSLSGVGDICTTTFSYTTDQGGVKRFDFIFPYVYTQQGGNIVKTLRWSVDSNNVWSVTQQTAT